MPRDIELDVAAGTINHRWYQDERVVEASSGIPLILTLLLCALAVPEEVSFYIFGLRLTVARLICLLLAPVVVVKGLQKISTGQYKFVPSDLFIALAGFWLIYAPANVDDVASAFNHAGPTVLEFGASYLATRILLREHGQAVSFAGSLCKVIAVIALLGALDPVTDHRFVHDWAGELFAPLHSIVSWDDAYRLGLLRAGGPIEHPILYGFICAIGCLIAMSVPIRGRTFAIVCCALGTMLALSSAPIQVLLMGSGLVLYDALLSKVAHRWSIFKVIGIITIASAFLISSNPIGFIITNLTFSPQSGYYREWTWAMVGLYVSQSPWYGLGFGPLPDEINHSIDSLWLILSIQAGYPAALFVGLTIVGASPIGTRGRKADLTPAESKLATTVGIVLFLTVYIAFTVHIWGSIWILTGLLAGLKAHLSELGYVKHLGRHQQLTAEYPGLSA
jgi:hypothetical protein